MPSALQAREGTPEKPVAHVPVTVVIDRVLPGQIAFPKLAAEQVLRTHAGDTDEAQTPVIEHVRTGAPLYPVTHVPVLLDPAFVAGHAAFSKVDSAEQYIG